MRTEIRDERHVRALGDGEERGADEAAERDVVDDSSDEDFDRLAFAADVLGRVRPRLERVVVASGHHHVEVESGRYWGHERGPSARWAIMSVPRRASSRSIVLAAASLAGPDTPAWSLDVLMADAAGSGARERR